MSAIKQSIRQVIILLSITLFSTHMYAKTTCLGSVKGHIYHDRNANDVQNNSEQNLSHIRIILTDIDNDVQVAFTNQDGNYCISGAAEGEATVYVDETTLPVGMIQTEGTNPTAINILYNKCIFEENNGYVFISDLVTKKTVDTIAAQEGSTIVYTLTVTNKGPAQATHVSLTDKLPAGLIYVSHTGGNYIANSGIWSIGTLNNGATATLNITVRVDQGTVGSTITNVATAASTPDQTDPTTGDDDLDEAITIGAKPIMTISDVKVIEGTPLVFDINLSNPSAEDIVIALNTVDGTATEAEDYTATTQTVTIPAGSQGITFTVPTIDDTLDEIDEENLTIHANVTVGTVVNPTISAIGTIIDNDGTPIVTIGGHNSDGSTKDVREIEGTPLVFDINLSNPSAEDIVIALNTVDGTATEAEDYTATTQTVTIPAGSQGITFTVPTIDDTIDEADEESIKVNVTITEGTVSNPTLSALGMILDNDVMTQRDTLVSDLSGVPTSINILDNDSNSTNPQSINLIPHENTPVGTTMTDVDGDGDIDTVIVSGEGVWSVDDDGIVTFTPEDGFTGDPTPIDYTVEDDHGHISKPTQIQADYPQTSTLANDDNMSGNVGDEISINVLENDMDQEDDINISSVNLIVPENAPEGTTPIDTDGDGDIDRIVVPGEGVWSVDDNGIVTFTPEDGFTGDPTPISYTVRDDTNEISNQAIIRVDFLQELRDDNKTGIMHRPVEILILDNDDKVDPSSVNLHASGSATEDDTNNDGDVDKIIVPGEGVWSIDENATLVFVPEVSFEDDPTSITYTAEDENKNPAGSAMVNIHYVGIGGLIEPQAVDDTLTVLSSRGYRRDTAENDIAGEGGKDKQIYHLLDPDTGIEIAVGEKVKLKYGSISMQVNGHYIYSPYVNVKGGEDTIKYSMKDTLDQTSSANILIKVACTSSQLSDSGGNKNIIYLLLMFLFMGMTGLYNIRKEGKSL